MAGSGGAKLPRIGRQRPRGPTVRTGFRADRPHVLLARPTCEPRAGLVIDPGQPGRSRSAISRALIRAAGSPDAAAREYQ
jgi:hypothetical protein